MKAHYDNIETNMIQHYSEIKFNVFGDERGSLISVESFNNLPFDIKRLYYIYNTVSGIKRGCHAHQTLKQCLIVVAGSCSVRVDDGNVQETFHLRSPNKGLIIEGLIWRELFDFSDDAVVIVLANDYYENTTYIRDYATFLDRLNNSNA